MVEGLYRGWDELRTVPAGQQSGLRVIVLFTDGASNSVPAIWTAAGHRDRAAHVGLPAELPAPDGQTIRPDDHGLLRRTGPAALELARHPDDQRPQRHVHADDHAGDAVHYCRRELHHASPQLGIPTTFPLVDRCSERQRRAAERAARPASSSGDGRIPAQVWNINNAASNLLEIIANEARNDTATTRSASTRSAWASW